MSFDVDPKSAFERMKAAPKAIYLDVRTVEEYEQGHPTGAWNIPIMHATSRGMAPNPDFQAVAARVLPKDAFIAVGCKSGQRSRMACEVLADMGHDRERLVNVAGGFHGKTDPFGRMTTPGWQACGLPSTTEPTAGRTWKDLSVEP